MERENMPERKRVGLALGCGASKGWAHIGAIEALEEAGIPIDCVAGCSIGGYVGALYTAGALKSLKDFVLRMDGKKIFSYFDVVFPRSGLLDGTKKLKELFSMHTDMETFSQLQIPLAMVAADLETGARVILNSGNLLEALRATMSLPGLFAPARIRDRWLVDGGILDPVPVGVCRGLGADVIIAVDLNSQRIAQFKKKTKKKERFEEHREFKNELLKKLSAYYESAGTGVKAWINDFLKRETDTPDILDTVLASVTLVQRRITRINLAVDPPDVLIQPRLGEIKMLEFDHVAQVIEEGYICAQAKIEAIRERMESP